MKEIKNTEELFSTIDFNTATVLFATNYYFWGLESVSANQYSFSFKKTDCLEETLKAFVNGKLRIDPRTFIEANRILKQKLEEARRS